MSDAVLASVNLKSTHILDIQSLHPLVLLLFTVHRTHTTHSVHTMLQFWSTKCVPNGPAIEWKQEKETLLHVTNICLADFPQDADTKQKSPVFVYATLLENQIEKKTTICVLRHGICENIAVELFFDNSVKFSIAGRFSVQLMGQTAGPSAAAAMESIESQPFAGMTSRQYLEQQQANSDTDSDDNDWQPGLDEQLKQSSSDSDSDDEIDEDHESMGKVLLRDVSGSKRKAPSSSSSTVVTKKNKKSSSSSDSGSDSDSDSDSDSGSDGPSEEVASNKGTQQQQQKDTSGTSNKTPMSVNDKLIKTLQQMGKDRAGAGAGDLGSAFRDAYGTSFKDLSGVKLTKYAKEQSQVFEVTDNLLIRLKQ